MTHGHSPRVRNGEAEQEATIQINTEVLANRVIDATLTAGVSLAVAQLLQD